MAHRPLHQAALLIVGVSVLNLCRLVRTTRSDSLGRLCQCLQDGDPLAVAAHHAFSAWRIDCLHALSLAAGVAFKYGLYLLRQPPPTADVLYTQATDKRRGAVARPQRALDPRAGPVQAFAAELRKLWEEAGQPTFLQMARKTGKSRTAMTEAVGGDHLPSWETVAAFVAVCGGKPTEWRARWENTREVRASFGQQAAQPDLPNDGAIDYRLRSWPRRLIPYAATVLATAVVASTVTALIVSATGSSPRRTLISRQARREAIVIVQNKVALSANSLIEDTTPSYLSSKPIPFCSHYGCEEAGTQVSSGAMLVAICYTYGAQMYNYNLDSTASQNNPYRASSRLWYKVVFPDQRSGYISEVYIVAADRGGMGLARCR